jgi:hypothetical protein
MHINGRQMINKQEYKNREDVYLKEKWKEVMLQGEGVFQ